MSISPPESKPTIVIDDEPQNGNFKLLEVPTPDPDDTWFTWRSFTLGFVTGSAVITVASYFSRR